MSFDVFAAVWLRIPFCGTQQWKPQECLFFMFEKQQNFGISTELNALLDILI
jgi:hypothetical protein